MTSHSLQSEGQHQTSLELLTTNFKQVICDLLNYINRVGIDVDIDYATYHLDWPISLCTRFGGHLEKEETFVGHLLHAQKLFSGMIKNDNQTTSSFVLDYQRNASDIPKSGRSRLNIPKEQIEFFVEYGFTATDIAKMLCVSVKIAH